MQVLCNKETFVNPEQRQKINTNAEEEYYMDIQQDCKSYWVKYILIFNTQKMKKNSQAAMDPQEANRGLSHVFFFAK